MKKAVHLFDVKTGLYAGETEIDCTPEGYYSLQSGMVEEAPPECPPGMYARRGMMGWELIAAEGLRRAAYEAEADVFRDQAMSYEEEAIALVEEGSEEESVTVTLKAAEARAAYLAKKREIRARYPGAAPVAEAERFALMSTGTYHRLSCSYATDAAEKLTLAEIAAAKPGANSCGKCNPPELPAE